jgi:chemotaxis protein CheD
MNPKDVLVRVAELQVGGGDDILITVGLGSCVAIVLHDSVVRVGGLAHVLLPSPALSRQDGNAAKFPQTAVPRLLELMAKRGASPRRITGRLVGGASMLPRWLRRGRSRWESAIWFPRAWR